MANNAISTPSSQLSAPSPVPAPWTCKCETYWLLLWLKNPLSPGIYHSLDAPAPNTANDDFKGGLGMIQVVRYLDTPVGPYDELLIIPGNYNVPGGAEKGKARLRISRIYVSQRETCYNGRKNWNIPKHLARFEFSSPPVTKDNPTAKTMKLAVYPLGSDDDTPPFFSATLTPSRYIPAVPMSTKYMPLNTYLVQPPCVEGADIVLAGTKAWRRLQITAHTKTARLMWVKVDESTEEDKEKGTHWPAVQPWSFGVWLENATLECPVAEEFEI